MMEHKLIDQKFLKKIIVLLISNENTYSLQIKNIVHKK